PVSRRAFFLRILPPPRPPLFPYTTLFRSRVRLLREALALWRGGAMQDVGLTDSEAFDAAVTRLEALRLTAMEDRFDAEVSLGHRSGEHTSGLPSLTNLVCRPLL